MDERMEEEVKSGGNGRKTAQQDGKEEDQDEKGHLNSAFEGIYDRMPDISIKAVDRFILLCVIALVTVVLVGILRANHVF